MKNFSITPPPPKKKKNKKKKKTKRVQEIFTVEINMVLIMILSLYSQLLVNQRKDVMLLFYLDLEYKEYFVNMHTNQFKNSIPDYTDLQRFLDPSEVFLSASLPSPHVLIVSTKTVRCFFFYDFHGNSTSSFLKSCSVIFP